MSDQVEHDGEMDMAGRADRRGSPIEVEHDGDESVAGNSRRTFHCFGGNMYICGLFEEMAISPGSTLRPNDGHST